MNQDSGWVVLHAGALGDLALTLHLAASLSSICRCPRIALFSRVDCGEVSELRPPVERRGLEGLATHWLYLGEIEAGPPPERLALHLAGRRVLSALGPHGGVVHRSLVRLGAKQVVSIDPPALPGAAVHIVSQWQRQIEAAGELIDKCVYHARGPQPPQTRQRVLIHPGSGGLAKCWPLASFVEIARRLLTLGKSIAFAIGPAEAERWPREVVESLAREFPLEICESADAWLRAARSADLVIGNDSGPMQLAALIGRPTLSLFGPTSATVWRPVGPLADVLQGDPGLGPTWGIEPERVVRRATPPP